MNKLADVTYGTVKMFYYNNNSKLKLNGCTIFNNKLQTNMKESKEKKNIYLLLTIVKKDFY